MRSAVWLGGLLATIALAVTSGARAQQTQPLPPAEAEAQKRERAALLSQVFQDAVRRRSVPALAPVELGLGLLTGGLGVRYGAPLFIASGATMVAGGVGFYLVSEQRDYELVIASMQAGLGLMYLGLPFDEPHPRWQIPIATGHFVTSALAFVNMAYSRHPGRARLVADWRRVRTPAGRSGLSEAELYRIEQNLYDTDPFLPNWLLGLPTILGGVAGAVPLFDADVEARDKNLIGAYVGLSLIHGAAFALTTTPAAEYRAGLERAGLWAKWLPTPGGMSIVGGFD